MLSRSEASLLRGLATRRRRAREGLFLAEGPHVVGDLLASPLEPRLVAASSTFVDTERGRVLADLAAARGVVLRIADERSLASLSRTETPRGIVAAAAIPDRTMDDLSDRDGAVLLVLDAVQDPGNVGTLVRTADALGAEAVVALDGTADPWAPKVVRAAAGALFRLPVARVGPDACFAWARSRGVTVLVADAAGSSIAEGQPRLALGESPTKVGDGPAETGGKPATMLVLGNEGAGAGAEARAAGRLVAVPQRPGAESLNVAAAGAILLWELLRPEGA